MPIFVAVLFGMIDYGWYFYQKFTLAAAIREGVRLGATIKSSATPGPAARALTEAQNRCDAGSLPHAAVTWTSGMSADPAPLQAVWVTGVYTFHPLVGLVPMPHSNMTYTMQMLLEQQY